MIETFHFLRPWWFIALIPALIIFIYSLNKTAGRSNWNEHCDPHLLKYLLVHNQASHKTWLPYILLLIWLVMVFALSGPTWSRYAEPIYQKNIARIIALDVSTSMNANDITPSRLERAKYKVLDLLHDIKEGQTGMLVFSSDAFVVSPLTTDTNTIASMVPVLDSNIVPIQGSDIAKALQKSAKLLSQAGYSTGEIILITASTPSASALDEAAKLTKDGYIISVLAVGTNNGGPITKTDGGLETDEKGNVIFAKLDTIQLEKLAQIGKGNYLTFVNDNSDLKKLLNYNNLNDINKKPNKISETKNLWRDEGHWLVWLLLILSPFIARKGWLEKIC